MMVLFYCCFVFLVYITMFLYILFCNLFSLASFLIPRKQFCQQHHDVSFLPTLFVDDFLNFNSLCESVFIPLSPLICSIFVPKFYAPKS